MATGTRRLVAVAGGIVVGLGLGGILSIVLTGTQSMNTGVPVVLAGIAIGLGAGMIAAALIGTERSRD
ncbi:MAG TPA: hypothetical protein VF916_05585, partial [Ktedonobacterales bacterium]